MKNYILSLFFLSIYFISGCEESTVNQKPIKYPQKIKTNQKKITEETKKHTVLYKKSKRVVKKKPSQSEDKGNPNESDHKVLDLSIPLISLETTNSENTSNYEQQDYLPDLFAEKNNNTLQIDGNIITREEEEIDKQRTVDGAGLGIKLIP